MSREMRIDSPLIIVFEHDGEAITHLHFENHTVAEYGQWIADIVRHAANAFKVPEDEVWEAVDKECYHPRPGENEEIKLQ
jgi:hypothetical protein